MKNKLKELHPFPLVLIMFIIGAFSFIFISGIVSIFINFFQPELAIKDLHLLADAYPVSYMLYFFMPFQLGFLLIPGGYYFLFLRERFKSTKFKWKDIFWASLLFTSLFFLLPLLNEINYNITKIIGFYEILVEQYNLNESRIQQLVGPESSLEAYIIGIIIIAIITAISEEMLFRGFIMNHIYKHTNRIGLSIIGSALIFALLHFNYLQLLPLIAFGIALGLMYHVSGTIIPSIFFHAGNNTINLYWVRNEIEINWMNEIDWKITVPSIILLMGLVYCKRKKIKYK